MGGGPSGPSGAEIAMRRERIAADERVAMHKMELEERREQREHELRMAGYQEKIAAAKAEAEAKAKELEAQREEAKKRHAAEIEEFKQKMSEEKEAHEKMLKSKDLDAMRERYDWLIASRASLLPVILKQQGVAMAKLLTLRGMQRELAVEQGRLSRFDVERDDDSVLRVVLYGPTGHGKSTFSNRITGDRSEKGDRGDFHVGHGVMSLTADIKKFIVRDVFKDAQGNPLTISVTDQPGRGDSEGRDVEFANNLVEYLRGIEFVNAFILVKTMSPTRWDKSFQDMLNELVGMVGTGVWKHVIVVLTHAGDGRACTKKYKDDVRQLLSRGVEMGDFDVSTLPIIPLELYATPAGEHTYVNPLSAIVTKLVPRCGRFSCEGIVSPIDVLQNEVKNAAMEYADEKQSWRGHMETDKEYASQIESLAKEMQSLDESFEIDETAFAFPRDGVRLSMEDEDPDGPFVGEGEGGPGYDDDEKMAEELALMAEWRCDRCGLEPLTSETCSSCGARFADSGVVIEKPMWQCSTCTMMNDETDAECGSCFSPRP